MKVLYSRVYRHHWRKKPMTWIRCKQGRSSKGLSNKKLISYVQGNISRSKVFDKQIRVYTTERILYTEVSLESFRMTLTRLLSSNYVKTSWCYQLCKHTHIILRQHKLPQGGTVDRISMGMRLAYGSPFARAAHAYAQDTLIILRYNSAICKTEVIKTCLKKASNKLSKKISIKQVL